MEEIHSSKKSSSIPPSKNNESNESDERDDGVAGNLDDI
jgi:hypothetical protein